MAEDIKIKSLFPVLGNPVSINSANNISGSTFIGIDFGTSTTVVSIASLDIASTNIKTEPIWLNQKLEDGTSMSSEKIPTVIAWHNEKLLIGTGAANLKYILKKGINVWYSFKMELGEDLGSKYYNSELDRNSETPILNPGDAAKVFFTYLKAQIDRYIRSKKLPSNLQFAVSIPASFEANQRKDLIQALEQNGISVNKQSLIDEPNAAFLSYVQTSTEELNPIKIPDGDNPKVLVFDFGAGTCDVSILELGKDLYGIYSKNLSISKFEKLGGDDIDRNIASECLFPQLLSESGKKTEDFRTPEKNRILNQLMKSAEQLKIMICENVGLQMSNWILPEIAESKKYVSIGTKIEVDSRKGMLTLSEPKLSYSEFNEIMNSLLAINPDISFLFSNLKVDIINIFSPIETALKKAFLNRNEIDYVLLIGGSSKNPYVQTALKGYFTESELLVPRDLQTHVSSGAALHSLIYNGFNKNIIKPITSEPLLAITKDNTPKVILRAGTQIPCDLIVIDELITDRDGQQAIEIPICLGNINKMLYNMKIVSSSPAGFKRNTQVKLELEVTADKLLKARASAAGQSVFAEPINPFANRELSTNERIVLRAERQANIEAERNGGKPTKKGLEQLYEAYESSGNNLRAAETLEILNELYPNSNNFNKLGVLYSGAGLEEKAFEYFKLAYERDKSYVTAFNFARELVHKDVQKSILIFEESLKMNPAYPYSWLELGRLIKEIDQERSISLISRAFNYWKDKFEKKQLSGGDYGWFYSAANELGMSEYALQILQSKPSVTNHENFKNENLTISSRDGGLITYS